MELLSGLCREDIAATLLHCMPLKMASRRRTFKRTAMCPKLNRFLNPSQKTVVAVIVAQQSAVPNALGRHIQVVVKRALVCPPATDSWGQRQEASLEIIAATPLHCMPLKVDYLRRTFKRTAVSNGMMDVVTGDNYQCEGGVNALWGRLLNDSML
mmetsp:Transcript_12354/g.18532  ORF Transcript_12354/g.18532 Transcript_12354/m.18532 type:complete len:155 (+) Transcript_12354:471-935(+)